MTYEPPCKNCGRELFEHRFDVLSGDGLYVNGFVYICPTATYEAQEVVPEEEPWKCTYQAGTCKHPQCRPGKRKRM
jgi:hypothetical protein